MNTSPYNYYVHSSLPFESTLSSEFQWRLRSTLFESTIPQFVVFVCQRNTGIPHVSCFTTIAWCENLKPFLYSHSVQTIHTCNVTWAVWYWKSTLAMPSCSSRQWTVAMTRGAAAKLVQPHMVLHGDSRWHLAFRRSLLLGVVRDLTLQSIQTKLNSETTRFALEPTITSQSWIHKGLNGTITTEKYQAAT